MTASSKKFRIFNCEICGLEQKRYKRTDSKFRFCGKKCAGKSGIKLAAKIDKTGKNNPSWKGGILFIGGYKYISIGNKKRKSEHRIVVENFLGRKLLRKEIVHHINHNKLDNRIENLEVMSQSEHIKRHIMDGSIKIDYWKGKKMSIEMRLKMMGKRKSYVSKN